MGEHVTLRGLWNRFCLLRFIVVGFWNSFFSYVVFAVLYYAFGGGWHDIVVQVVAGVIGITNAYILHRIITYRSHGVWWQEYLRFYVVYGGQLLVQMAFFLLLTTCLGLNGYIVQLVMMIALTVLSYWTHKVYSFRNERVVKQCDS